MEIYESTIRKTSKSDDGTDFIKSDVKVYDFDAFTKTICNAYRNKKTLGSVDAFALSDTNEELWFIEFKNARKSRVPKKSLQIKAYDSMYTAYFFLKEKYSLNEIKSRAVLFVVYNDDAIEEEQRENPSTDFLKFKTKMGEMARIDPENRILFGMDKYKGFLYKEIHTIGKEEFIEKYQSRCRLFHL